MSLTINPKWAWAIGIVILFATVAAGYYYVESVTTFREAADHPLPGPPPPPAGGPPARL